MDAELVIRAQRGDLDAFTSLVDAVGGRLHAVAYSILRDRELAADATQQALLSAWRDLSRLRDPARFEAWTYRLLVRSCYAEARHARRWMPALALDTEAGDPAADPSSGVIDRDQLERGFRRLSVEQRAVVVLRHYLDLPPAQVAEALGIPIGTVHSRLSRAIATLRAALDADGRPPGSPGVPSTGPEIIEVSR